MDNEWLKTVAAETLIRAGSAFSEDKIRAYKRAIEKEKNEKAEWVLKLLLENAETAAKNKSPLCDDTGIPHVCLEIGRNVSISGENLSAIHDGIREGLKRLPGRPMAIQGNDIERLEQRNGLSNDPSDVLPAPFYMKYVPYDDIFRLYILMFGGGPAIRGKSYRVFHKHDISIIKNEIISWATEAVAKLGCTPATLAVGIGRSHYEAACMMLEAQMYGNYDVQSPLEQEVTDAVNESRVGTLGLGGSTTLLAAFIKVAPQRASGVRIVCMRPCCCFEPRRAVVDLI